MTLAGGPGRLPLTTAEGPCAHMSPATLSLLPFAAATLSILTLVGWILVPDKGRHQSRLWFAGATVYTIASVALAIQSLIPPLALGLATSALPLLSVLLVTESLRRECGHKALPLWSLALAPCLYFGALLALRIAIGGVAAHVAHLCTITAIELFALSLLVVLGRQHTSRGLLVCAVGLGAICIANLARIGLLAIDRPLPPLDGGSPGSAALVIVFSLGVTVMSLGYWGFLLEQSHRDRVAATDAAARAQEAQRLSDAYSQRLQELVRQRDEMLTTASRFSTLDSLAILNAGIVHEVSQPLQGLLSYLETLAGMGRQEKPEAIAPHLDKARALASEAVQTLQALRRLAVATPATLEDVPVTALMRKIIPVIESESLQRGVGFSFSKDLPSQTSSVRAQPVMLERAILNLVTNALQAMAPGGKAMNGSRLALACEVETAGSPSVPRLLITVTDNGPGLGQAASQGPGLPLTTKPEGMGIGLLWVRLLLEQWGGEFQLLDRPVAQGSGAIAQVRLPLREADDATTLPGA